MSVMLSLLKSPKPASCQFKPTVPNAAAPVGLAGGPTAEKADHRHSRLLPPRALHLHREQQTAAADQANELTPRCVEHGLLPGPRRASLPQAQDAPEARAGPWGGTELF